jgi:lipopolysaccharide transport system permease protein
MRFLPEMRMSTALLSPADLIRQCWLHRHLIRSLAERELSARFRGSLLGGLWAVLQPIAVVAIFYYVLVVIFHTRWSADSNSDGDFIVGMFIGLLNYNMFAETVGRSTSVVISNVNYVKRIVFPITILPIVQLVFALVNFVIGFLVLLAFGLAWGILSPSPTWLALPLCLAPLLLWSLGLSWLAAAMNVYFRDTNILVPLLLQAMMFLSPVFYNFDRTPPKVQAILSWSPLTMPITEMRRVLMAGASLDVTTLLVPSLL